jgi:putative acetyltransferase
MNGTPHKLRPYLPSDAHGLRDLFAQSIEELTSDSYDEDQRLAWIETAENEAAFAARLASGLTLIVGGPGNYQGFATLQDGSKLDLLYVHPYSARQGVGTTLVDALERIAASRGATSITVDASDTALAFFDQRGYTPSRRNTIVLGDTWLSNTTMSKQLAPLAPAGPQVMS